MKDHNAKMHAVHWKLYNAMSTSDKRAYLQASNDGRGCNNESVANNYERISSSKSISIDKRIVETILRDVIHVAEDNEEDDEEQIIGEAGNSNGLICPTTYFDLIENEETDDDDDVEIIIMHILLANHGPEHVLQDTNHSGPVDILLTGKVGKRLY